MKNSTLKSWQWVLGVVLLVGAAGTGFYGILTNLAFADRDEYEYRDIKSFRGVSDPNPLYTEECGSCHLAYPPGLLPPQSWEKIMDNLEAHYGDNAALEEEDSQKILNYLLNNAAGRIENRRMNRFIKYEPENATPLRITKLRYFIKEHDEIPTRLVTNNDKIGTFSRCESCHSNAEQGYFDEHDVAIPGYGRWDD